MKTQTFPSLHDFPHQSSSQWSYPAPCRQKANTVTKHEPQYLSFNVSCMFCNTLLSRSRVYDQLQTAIRISITSRPCFCESVRKWAGWGGGGTVVTEAGIHTNFITNPHYPKQHLKGHLLRIFCSQSRDQLLSKRFTGFSELDSNSLQ
jgi:hypothetical protein